MRKQYYVNNPAQGHGSVNMNKNTQQRFQTGASIARYLPQHGYPEPNGQKTNNNMNNEAYNQRNHYVHTPNNYYNNQVNFNHQQPYHGYGYQHHYPNYQYPGYPYPHVYQQSNYYPRSGVQTQYRQNLNNYGREQGQYKVHRNEGGSQTHEMRKNNVDPRIEMQKTTFPKGEQRQKKTDAYSPLKSREQKKFQQKQKQQENEKSSLDSSSSKSSQSEDEEQIYQKTKTIVKKRDPVMDSPQQIRKWIEARRRNYPRANRIKSDTETAIESEMSILESKIRKKIMLVTADGRGLIKKLKNMHILKRLITEPNFQSNRDRINRIRMKQQKAKNIEQVKRKSRKTAIQKQKSEIADATRQKTIEQQHRQTIKQGQPELHEGSNSEQPEQQPILKESDILIENIQNKVIVEEIEDKKSGGQRGNGSTPEDMIKHLKQKQKEDKQFYEQLLNYKTNSLNYKYSSQTLQTNLVLENIFEESCYLLQIIRHIVKNQYFDQQTQLI